jgi:regulator of RNase E activity RraA
MQSYAQLVQQLYSAVLSDVLDSLGFMHQAMRPFMRPVDDALAFMGPARTGLYMPTYEVRADENPYELEMRLIDDLKAGEVAVLAAADPPSASRRGANCSPRLPARAAPQPASRTGWCVTCATSARWGSPCTTGASVRWTPRGGRA